MAPVLELKKVSKAFGGLDVISGLDLHVDEHEIVSVIGPNGAGKTTLFNIVTGVYRPDDGDVLFEGESIVGIPPYQITQRGIARTFQTLRLFLNMSVIENVMASQYGQTKVGVAPTVNALSTCILAFTSTLLIVGMLASNRARRRGTSKGMDAAMFGG